MTGIGARLRELRVAKGMTQTALAGEGISAGYVSLIEAGKRTPSVAMVEALAERLGVSTAELLEPAASTLSQQAHIEVNFARLALANGSADEAVRSLTQLNLSQLDSDTAAEATLVLAESLMFSGQLEKAVDTLETMIDRCRREGAWLAFSRGAIKLVMIYVESGDLSLAVEAGRAALGEVENAGLEGTDEHIRLGATLVWASFERGDLLDATRRADVLVRIADRVGTTRARGSIYWNAAIVAHGRGRVSDALRLTDRAVALLGEQEDHRDMARLRMHYAWLLLHHDTPRAAEALEQLDRAEKHPALEGSRLDLGIAASYRAMAHLCLDNLDDAAEQAARALQLLGPTGHVERATALITLGDVGTARGDEDLAREAYAEARLVLSGMKESRPVARMWRDLGDGLRELGDIAGASTAYETALTISGLTRGPAVNRSRVRAHAG